jgi:lysophospholipid acyltransferase (LPLAT)-like uncharacterized protein
MRGLTRLRRRLGRVAAARAGAIFIRLLAWTIRIEFIDPRGWVLGGTPGPLVFAFWHSRLFLMPYVFQRYRKGHEMVAMISRSRDGDVISEIAASFGVGAARGSSSKRGGLAMRAMIREVQEGGSDAGVTPDGPRGPRGVVQRGVLILARATGRPVLPLRLEFSAKWQLRSWDRFQIPKPLARCTITVGEPLAVPADATDEDLARLAKELAGRLGEA